MFSVFDPASTETQGAGGIDQQEVIAGLEIICKHVSEVFLDGPLCCFRIFAEKLTDTLTKHYAEIAHVYFLCFAASPNAHLWKQAKSRGLPACVEIDENLVQNLCNRSASIQNRVASGQFGAVRVCYDAEELKLRITPFCKTAFQALEEAAQKANGDKSFLYKFMEEMSKLLALVLMIEAYGYKHPDFSSEDEVRLIKVFPYGYEVDGQSELNGRRYIREHIATCFKLTTHDECPT